MDKALEEKATREIEQYLRRNNPPASLDDQVRHAARQMFSTALDAAQSVLPYLDPPAPKELTLPRNLSGLTEEDRAELKELMERSHEEDEANRVERHAKFIEANKELMKQAFTGSAVSDATAAEIVEALCAGS